MKPVSGSAGRSTLGCSFATTRSAHALVVTGHVGVVGGQFVSVLAVRPLGEQPSHVLRAKHQLQVLSVCAQRIAAQVIDLHIVGDMVERQSMDVEVSHPATVLHGDLPVAPVRSARPQKASSVRRDKTGHRACARRLDGFIPRFVGRSNTAFVQLSTVVPFAESLAPAGGFSVAQCASGHTDILTGRDDQP